MKISIIAGCRVNGKSGVANYLSNGTKHKPRDQSKVEVLQGNLKLGDAISESGKWKDNEYKIVLAFKGKPSRLVIRNAVKRFEKEFLHGFDKSEYHMDAVVHRDTEHYHVHIRIPKLNLVTGTALRLYMDSQDRDRVNLIRDIIIKENNIEIQIDDKPLILEDNQLQRIEKWRKEQGQEPFNFMTKKGRSEAEAMIGSAIGEYHEGTLINSFEDVKAFICEELGFEIVKNGYDKPKDFHYLSIKDRESAKTIRIKGDLYNAEWWNNPRTIRQEQIRNNKEYRRERGADKRELADLERELVNVNKRREEEVTRNYRRARERASQKARKENVVPYYNHNNSRDSAPFSISYADTYNVSEEQDKSSDSKLLEASRQLLGDTKEQDKANNKDTYLCGKEINNDNIGTEINKLGRGECEAKEFSGVTATSLLDSIKEATDRIKNLIGQVEQWITQRGNAIRRVKDIATNIFSEYGREAGEEEHRNYFNDTQRVESDDSARYRGEISPLLNDLFGRVQEDIASEKVVFDAVSRNEGNRNKWKKIDKEDKIGLMNF